MRKVALSTLVMIFLAIQAFANDPGGSYAIAGATGLHHESDLHFEDGDKIWIITHSGAIKSGKARVKTVKHDAVDEDDKMTGKDFSLAGQEYMEGLVYIRSPVKFKNPKSLPIDSECSVPSIDFSLDGADEDIHSRIDKKIKEVNEAGLPSGKCTIKVGKHAFQIKYKTTGVVSNVESQQPIQYETTYSIARDGIEQTLPGDTLLWAGDLDGDGGLDLLMGTSNHHYASASKGRIYLLMSITKDTSLVLEVASYEASGC